jgi:hypothetical protein
MIDILDMETIYGSVSISVEIQIRRKGIKLRATADNKPDRE